MAQTVFVATVIAISLPGTSPNTCGDGHRHPYEVDMRPLDGVTVVSLEHAIAAPFCTRQLADLGTRVIKVERLS